MLVGLVSLSLSALANITQYEPWSFSCGCGVMESVCRGVIRLVTSFFLFNKNGSNIKSTPTGSLI